MIKLSASLSPKPTRHPRYPTFRLDMLIDGIFAIAATLLVLELRVPVGTRPGHLGPALLHLWPGYLVYAMGFLQISAGWLTTRRISAWTIGIDHYATVGILLTLATFVLTPFTTSVLASSLHNHADFGSAVRLMAIVLTLAMLFLGPTGYYLHRRGFFRADLDPDSWLIARWLIYTAWMWPLAALLLSYLSPLAATVLIAAYFLMNLWPLDALTTEGYLQAD